MVGLCVVLLLMLPVGKSDDASGLDSESSMQHRFLDRGNYSSVPRQLLSLGSPWAASAVPNPNKDPKACNIPAPGPLCDPDALLSARARADILDALTALREKTVAKCPDSGDHGYQLGVLIISKMVDGGWFSSVDSDAKQFATEVGDAWGVGDRGCDNGIVLFLSIEDRYAYIKTTDMTQQALTDEKAELIIDNMKPELKSKLYDQAVLQGVLQTFDVLMGKQIPGEWEKKMQTVGSIVFFCVVIFCVFPSPVCFVLATMVGVLLMPFAMLLDACVSCGRRSKAAISTDSTGGNAEADLSWLQAEMERDEFDQTICPICLETLGSGEEAQGSLGKVKRLDCRHCYHRDCIDPWVQEHGSCPLCRADVTVQLDKEEETRPDAYQRRLRFLLSRLQHRRSDEASEGRPLISTTSGPVYQRDRNGRWVYLPMYSDPWYGYGYYGYSPSVVGSDSYVGALYSHFTSVTEGARSFQAAVHSSSGGGGGGGHSSSFGGGGGFDGGGGGGGGW